MSMISNYFNTPYKFTSKELDSETGLYYFGARYYSSDMSIWLSVDPLSDKRSWLSPYNYCQWNPIRRVDPDGALDGNFISESGKLLGNDGIDDGKVYVVKTTQTTPNTNKREDPNTPFAGISSTERDKTESFISSNSGNTEAFQGNDIAYRNSVEIVGDAALRQGMVDIVRKDNGKGLSRLENNQEHGGNIVNGRIIPAKSGPVGSLKFDQKYLFIDLLADSPSFHSHASGTFSPMIDFNTLGAPRETKFWMQSPSKIDIDNAGNRTNYVFGRGNSTVYIYNSQGVQATIPENYFVNPQK